MEPKLNKNILLNDIIIPVLTKLDLDSLSARNLLLGTAAQESALGTYRKQINGPALGIYQMEPTTYQSIWDDYLFYRQKLGYLVANFSINSISDVEQLVDNDKYSTAMTRVFYLRCPEKLPDADDILGLAQYYKKYYNTYKGKATVEQFVDNYRKYVL